MRCLRTILLLFFLLYTLLLPSASSAASFEDISMSIGLEAPDLKGVLVNIINWLLGLLGLANVVTLLTGGFRWMTSHGDDDLVMKAKRTITGAIIGVIIVLLAWSIVHYILQTATNVVGVV